MNKIISKRYDLTLDTKERIAFVDPSLFCKQNDSIIFHITITEDGKPKDIEGCQFSLLSNRSDGTSVEQIIDIPTIESGVLILKPKKEFTSVKASMVSELTIFDEDEAITIQSFNFSVVSTIQNSLPEDSKDSVDTLIELNLIMQKYKSDLDYIKGSITDINEMLSDEVHIHLNKQILDTISTEDVEAVNKIGIGLINNQNISIIEALNELYTKVNSMIFYRHQ